MNGFEHATVFPKVLPRELEYQLPHFLSRQRWFGGKARTIRQVQVTERIALPAVAAAPELTPEQNLTTQAQSSTATATPSGTASLEQMPFWLLIIAVHYTDGSCDRYALPVTVQPANAALASEAVILRWASAEWELAVCESSRVPAFWVALAGLLTGQYQAQAAGDQSVCRWTMLQTSAFSLAQAEPIALSDVKIFTGEQSQSLAVLRQALVVKLFRRLDEGISPDWEITRYLTEEAHFRHVPEALAALALTPEVSQAWLPGSSNSAVADGQEMVMLAMMTSYQPNRGDAWSVLLGELAVLCERVLEAEVNGPEGGCEQEGSVESMLALAHQDAPAAWQRLAGTHWLRIRLLGQRTAELHLALAHSSHPAFAPEPADRKWQSELADNCLRQVKQAFELLRRRLPELPGAATDWADRVLAQEAALHAWILQAGQRHCDGLRIRIHGDYHLGQVLCTEEDFVILDFEGEPARPLAERRRKHSPLRDVAGMIRSFHYAAAMAEHSYSARSGLQRTALAAWLHSWYIWTAAAFLQGYLQTPGIRQLLPTRDDDLAQLLALFLIEKAAYELGYELNHRPDWVEIPLRGLAELASQLAPVATTARTAS